MCIDLCLFPASLKGAEVTPIHKTNDVILKLYRPVSFLPILPKVFEGILMDQLSEYFKHHLISPYISGFVKGYEYDCQRV